MIFLERNDFAKQIKEDILDVIINNDESILYEAELATIEEMTSYLALRYDAANIFNRAGNERNPLIKMYAIDILLYHLHSRVNPRKIPELRGIRYEAAISTLTKISIGNLSPNLPAKQVENQENTIITLGKEPRNNYY